MKKLLLLAAVTAAASLAIYLGLKSDGSKAAGASGSPQSTAIVDVILPDVLSETAQLGKRAFESACINCHGENAAGKQGDGPPLVHKIYEPSHHADYAFLMAVENGVRSHHWPFGNMPPQEGFTQGDVKAIIAYVRELQRANGIN
jgi:mono/diheme cytochrome c family protein